MPERLPTTLLARPSSTGAIRPLPHSAAGCISLGIEERNHRRRQNRSAEERVVRLARQNREPRLGPPRAVPPTVALAPTQQAEQLDRMRGREDVGIARDHE